MKANVGRIDRIARLAVGAAMIGLGVWALGCIAAVIFWVVGGVLFLTGLTGLCLLYALFHIDTSGRPRPSAPRSHGARPA